MPSRQVDLDASARAGGPARNGALDDGTLEIASDVAYRRLAIVNVVFSGRPGARDRDRVLIDAGLFGTKALIRRRRGASVWSSRPSTIILTDGHFDHVCAKGCEVLRTVGDDLPRWS